MGLARHSPQLLPGSFFPGLTRCSASTFVPAALLLWGWERLMGWGRAMASHPTLWPDILFCSDLIERRRQKGVKSAHGQPGGDMEEGACPANKDLAKCSHCVCTVSLLWARGCSCGLPHLHPSTLSFCSSYLTVSIPFTSAQSTPSSLGANQSGFLTKPLVLTLPPPPPALVPPTVLPKGGE